MFAGRRDAPELFVALGRLPVLQRGTASAITTGEWAGGVINWLGKYAGGARRVRALLGARAIIDRDVKIEHARIAHSERLYGCGLYLEPVQYGCGLYLEPVQYGCGLYWEPVQ